MAPEVRAPNCRVRSALGRAVGGVEEHAHLAQATSPNARDAPGGEGIAGSQSRNAPTKALSFADIVLPMTRAQVQSGHTAEAPRCPRRGGGVVLPTALMELAGLEAATSWMRSVSKLRLQGVGDA